MGEQQLEGHVVAPVRIEGPVDGGQPSDAEAFVDPESAQARHPRATGSAETSRSRRVPGAKAAALDPSPSRLFDSRDPIRAIPAILEMPGHHVDSIVRDAPPGEQAPGLEIRA